MLAPVHSASAVPAAAHTVLNLLCIDLPLRLVAMTARTIVWTTRRGAGSLHRVRHAAAKGEQQLHRILQALRLRVYQTDARLLILALRLEHLQDAAVAGAVTLASQCEIIGRNGHSALLTDQQLLVVLQIL